MERQTTLLFKPPQPLYNLYMDQIDHKHPEQHLTLESLCHPRRKSTPRSTSHQGLPNGWLVGNGMLIMDTAKDEGSWKELPDAEALRSPLWRVQAR